MRDSKINFKDKLRQYGFHLRRTTPKTLQINVGKLCNQACIHCHVDAGPERTEIMSAETADKILNLLANTPSIELVDFTGGAPELNPAFRSLVKLFRSLGRRIMDRCNLTVLFVNGQEDLAEFFKDNCVEVIASLPCYSRENVDKQRGSGVFDKSIDALRRLNSLGYGHEGNGLRLDLVYNPGDAFLPPSQEKLEKQYKKELSEQFGIVFNRLYTMTNMPIRRWEKYLERTGQVEYYRELLVNAFNPQTVDSLMCRTLISVGWDGQLYDCDFNQMLEIPIGGRRRTIWDIESFDEFNDGIITTGVHCFGCTAEAGSSCGGSLLMV
ncbi:MAG: radical SAM/Cys-rich domain protein [Candidatus Brocadia sp.]|nr:radical SAM/Cys-rich domain protein [Candidatus Brocadia sp.]